MSDKLLLRILTGLSGNEGLAYCFGSDSEGPSSPEDLCRGGLVGNSLGAHHILFSS